MRSDFRTSHAWIGTVSIRNSIQKASIPLVIKLNDAPKGLVLITVGGLLTLGLFNTGAIGGVSLALVGLFTGWLLYLSAPVLTASKTAFRTLVVLLVFVSAYFKFTA
jgi:hypothetical protein